MNRAVLALADALARLGLPQTTKAKIAASEGSVEHRVAARDVGTRQPVEHGLAFGWGVISVILAVFAVVADQVVGRAASWKVGHIVFWLVLVLALGTAASCLLRAGRMLRLGRRWID